MSIFIIPYVYMYGLFALIGSDAISSWTVPQTERIGLNKAQHEVEIVESTKHGNMVNIFNIFI